MCCLYAHIGKIIFEEVHSEQKIATDMPFTGVEND